MYVAIIENGNVSWMSTRKGLIWHVEHSCCNYNIIFWKLDIQRNKIIPVLAGSTSSWGWPNFPGLDRSSNKAVTW